MKMIKCPRCGQVFESTYPECPGCGLSRKRSPQERRRHRQLRQRRKMIRLGVYAAIAILIIMAIVLLTRCGDSKSKPSTTKTESTKKTTTTSANGLTEVTIKETTVWDENDVVIKALQCAQEKDGMRFDFEVSNNSSAALTISPKAIAINGFMINPSDVTVSCDAAPETQAAMTMTIANSAFEQYDITTVKMVELIFNATNTEKAEQAFETDIIKLETDKYDETATPISGDNLLSKDGISADYISSDDQTATFCISNTTGSPVNFDISGLTINDQEVPDKYNDSTAFDVMLFNNAQTFITISMEDGFKDDFNISKLEKVAFRLAIRPNSDFSQEYSTDPIEVSVKTTSEQ